MTERQLPPWPDFRGFDPNDMIARRDQARVGALVFTYNVNRRVYRGTGINAGGPIERYYFGVDKIEGETRVSWILTFGEKSRRRIRAPFMAAMTLKMRFGIASIVTGSPTGSEIRTRTRSARSPR